jgi:glutamine synthetase
MNRKQFDVAAGIAERIDKLEKTIFDLEKIKNKKSYKIVAQMGITGPLEVPQSWVELNEGEIATEVFIQDVLDYYINTLNLELDELRKSFEEI